VIPTLHLRIEADESDLTEAAYSFTVRRGLELDGVTDEPDPASATLIVKGGESVNPLTNPDVRPGRPLRVLAGIEDTYGDAITWHTIATCEILRNTFEHDADAKHDAEAYRAQITATDLVADLAATPSEVAVSGTLTQRAAAVLDPTGLPYAVTDLDPATTSGALATDAKTVLGQLRLIRDTLHAAIYVDRHGVLQLVADNSRPREHTSPDHVATDEDPAPDGAILYHDLTPVFDTDAVVNVLTVKSLDLDTETTYTDEDSRTAWGAHPQTVTVNDGLPETHAGLYLATRTDPDLLPESLAFAVDPYADTFPAHLAAACTIEINDIIDVTRLGVTHRLAVHELTHTIALVLDPLPRLRWSVEVGLRVPPVLATRWDDVPADLTWDDVPADLTWDAAVNWHPYLGA
jgi:hypothetical protein